MTKQTEAAPVNESSSGGKPRFRRERKKAISYSLAKANGPPSGVWFGMPRRGIISKASRARRGEAFGYRRHCAHALKQASRKAILWPVEAVEFADKAAWLLMVISTSHGRSVGC